MLRFTRMSNCCNSNSEFIKDNLYYHTQDVYYQHRQIIKKSSGHLPVYEAAYFAHTYKMYMADPKYMPLRKDYNAVLNNSAVSKMLFELELLQVFLDKIGKIMKANQMTYVDVAVGSSFFSRTFIRYTIEDGKLKYEVNVSPISHT